MMYTHSLNSISISVESEEIVQHISVGRTSMVNGLLIPFRLRVFRVFGLITHLVFLDVERRVWCASLCDYNHELCRAERCFKSETSFGGELKTSSNPKGGTCL